MKLLTFPKLTFSKLINGFETWFAHNITEIQESFTAEAQETFGTLEDFAVEVYFAIKHPV